MSKAIIISGYLNNLSDNIIPFLDVETDLYVHTWKDNDNLRWVAKLERYKKYCNQFNLIVEEPKYNNKLHSYFYSTWRAFNSIKNPETYSQIIKFKPNLDSDRIKCKFNLSDYFNKAALQSRPLLENVKKEECFFGSIYYKTMDERMFSGFPQSFMNFFSLKVHAFEKKMLYLDKVLEDKYGIDYEGSLFWMHWAENTNVPLVQDLDLIIPNNK